MGITGLIPFLEKASRPVDIDELSGATVAVDAYCWLHKGIVGCAEKLMRGEKTNIHIQFCLRQLSHLLSHRIRPILVFDGRHLAAKAGVEAERRESRKAAKAKAKELLAQGKKHEARSYLQRALDVSHAMALELIDACHERGVDCIVAPYEADGQLAYLNLKGIAEYVITEDSDLILFGCQKVLFKFNQSGGLLIEADKLHLAMGVRKEKFTFTKFRNMCILSGCDYLPSLPGIGLAKAKKFLLMTEETDMKRALGKLPSYLNMRQIVVTDEYKEGFLKAEATFKYMIVYDPKERKLTRLNEFDAENPVDPELLSNSGEFFDEELAYQLALGNIDPMSLKKVHDWDPDYQITSQKSSIWGNNKENGNHLKKKKNKIEPPTEEEIQAEHIKNIKMSFFTKINETEDDQLKIETEDDLVASYFDPECPNVQDEPPKKKLRTNVPSPRKSSNIFKAKPKSEKTPIKTPLTSPNQGNVSFIASLSSKSTLFESPTKNACVTPEKDIFAIAKQKTDEILSPAALKLLKVLQGKLDQPQIPRVRVSKNVPEIHESLSDAKSSSQSPDILTPVSENEEKLNDESSKPTQSSDNLSPVSELEPTVILIEDDSPIKLSRELQPTKKQKVTQKSRVSGLNRKTTLTKSKSQQKGLSHFGFVKNKK